jgi:hypothetical protein
MALLGFASYHLTAEEGVEFGIIGYSIVNLLVPLCA